MKAYDASDPAVAAVHCAVCDNLITGGRWFARIQRGRWMVALCCPLCTEVFERNPVIYIRRIETFASAPPE